MDSYFRIYVASECFARMHSVHNALSSYINVILLIILYEYRENKICVPEKLCRSVFQHQLQILNTAYTSDVRICHHVVIIDVAEI